MLLYVNYKLIIVSLAITPDRFSWYYWGWFSQFLACPHELVSLHLIKSYCLPRLLYGCEGISFSVLQLHELNIIWNNAFRSIFNCCWREFVKPLQFYCNTVPLSYMIDERKLLFYRNISHSKNLILKILMCLTGVLSDYMFLCSKYGVNCVSSKNNLKYAVMSMSMSTVDFYSAYIHSISGCIFVVLSAFICILCLFICICSFSVYVAYVAAFWRNENKYPLHACQWLSNVSTPVSCNVYWLQSRVCTPGVGLSMMMILTGVLHIM